MEFTRHDIPESVKDLLKVAIETKTYDIMTVYAAAVNFGFNFRALTEDVCEAAFANRHSSGNAHKLVVEAAELVWKELDIKNTDKDRLEAHWSGFCFTHGEGANA